MGRRRAGEEGRSRGQVEEGRGRAVGSNVREAGGGAGGSVDASRAGAVDDSDGSEELDEEQQHLLGWAVLVQLHVTNLPQ